MKKITQLTALLIISLFASWMPSQAQVIISQYYEGTSNNKWIEICNVGTSTIDLSTYFVGRWSGTDTPTGDPSNFTQLTGNIAAGEVKLYQHADAVLPDYATGEPSTSCYFNGDDPVAICDGTKAWEDRVDCIYASVASGKWGDNRSFVRNADVVTGNLNISVLDGTGEWTTYSLDDVDNAAAGTAERLGFHLYGGDIVADPTFNPNGGTFYGSVNVEINCSTDGATIYYTTNGSTPTSSSTVYSTPVNITATSTLKAIAEKDGNSSNVSSADFVISSLVLINQEPFEGGLGTWTQYSVIGDQVWEYASGYGNPPGCAKVSGYSGGPLDNEDWLISPSFDFNTISGEKFSFESAVGYTGPALTLMVSTDYDGSSAPSSATWTDLSASAIWGIDWSFLASGIIDLSSISGENVHLAFVYTSNPTDGTATWEVDNLLLTAESGAAPTAARIVGSMQGWNTTDPDYVMSVLPSGLYTLTKSLDAGSHEYKVLEGDDWSATNYPGTDQIVVLTSTENVTWTANIDTELVLHTAPVVVGDFMAASGLGTDWDPTNLDGEMSGTDYIYTFEAVVPSGPWSFKVTLNHVWDQEITAANVPFTSDGVNATTFTYNFITNEVSVTGPPPPTAEVTFIVNDTEAKGYDILYLKGSFNAAGNYDPTWNGGAEITELYDDGTHGDVTADDNIWTVAMTLTSDGGSNNWEWGINGPNHEWIDGNWQFTVPDATPQTLSQTLVYTLPNIVINELMYNPYPGPDEFYEFLELYNGGTETVDLQGNYMSGVDYVFETEYLLNAGQYLVLAINGDTIMDQYGITGVLTWTGGGINNGGELVAVRNATGAIIDHVTYDDAAPWPTEPDGDGPSLSLLSPELDNTLPESWAASLQNGGTPQFENFPAIPMVAVLNPNGGSYYEQGTMVTITWQVANFTGDLKIELVSASAGTTTLAASTPAIDGEWDWGIALTQTPSDDYYIRLSNAAGGDPVDESDASFEIIEPIVLPDVLITEIMYNSPDIDDLYEFIEIYNNDNQAVDLSGYSFSDGVDFVFPNGTTINSNAYLVIAKDSQAMSDLFGVTTLQWDNGGLSNGGELLELSHKYGPVVDAVEYSDSAPWPTECDGDGPSLTFCDPSLDNSIPENWAASVKYAATLPTGEDIFASPGAPCGPPLPVADFEASNTAIMTGNAIDFTDLSTDAESWSWTFEGATPATSSDQNPTNITYPSVGTFDVTLIVTNDSGEDTEFKEDYISVTNTPPPPGTNFEANITEIFVGQTIDCTDQSTNSPNAWDWSFEAGTPATSSDQNPSGISYTVAGVYDVELTATNNYGSNSELKEDYITVLDIVPDFNADQTSGTVGTIINFTDASIGNITTWDWTFEGGTPANSPDQNPTVTYNSTGSFDVTLSISNGFATEEITMTDYINIYDVVDVDLVITEIMYNPPESGDDTLEFVEIYNNGLETVEMEGFTLDGVTFEFPAYSLASNEFVVIGKNSDILLNTFGVNSLQWIDGGLSNSGETISLLDYNGLVIDEVTYSDAAPWPTECDGDGPSLTFCDPSLDNSIPENWAASTEFAGVNAEGNTIYATPGAPCGYFFPLADFEPSSQTVIVGTTIDFTDLSTGNPTSWEWTFESGDPANSTDQNPSVVYSIVGLFDVTLTVTNEYGSNTLFMSNFIDVGPDAIALNEEPIFNIYPNPSTGNIVIEHNMDGAEMEIFNLKGQIIYNSTLINSVENINLSFAEKGVYFVRFISKTSSATQKLIIK